MKALLIVVLLVWGCGDKNPTKSSEDNFVSVWTCTSVNPFTSESVQTTWAFREDSTVILLEPGEEAVTGNWKIESETEVTIEEEGDEVTLLYSFKDG